MHTVQLLHYIVHFESAEAFIAELEVDQQFVQRGIVRVTTLSIKKGESKRYALNAQALIAGGCLLSLQLPSLTERDTATAAHRSLEAQLRHLGFDVRTGVIRVDHDPRDERRTP
jgi:hypothetical protein